MDKGGVVGAVFLDLQKAFDTVNYNILLHKLLNLNFSTKSLNLIESYLSSRSQVVKMYNYKSNSLCLAHRELVFHKGPYWDQFSLACKLMIYPRCVNNVIS